MSRALQELHRDLLIDNVCGPRTRSALGKKEKPKRREKKRTVFGEQHLERRVATTFRRDPVARLECWEQGVAHVLGIGRRFHTVGDSVVQAILENEEVSDPLTTTNEE